MSVPTLRAYAHRLLWPLLAGTTVALYYTVLILPYNLFALWPQANLTLGKLTASDAGAGLRLGATFIALSLLHIAAYRHAQRVYTRAAWAWVVATLVLCNLGLFCLYPLDASDVFDNIMRGRMSTLYAVSPFAATPNQFPSDAAFPYAAWRAIPSAYGPLWELSAAALVKLAGPQLFTELLVFKAASIGAYALCLLLIADTLRRHSIPRSSVPRCSAPRCIGRIGDAPAESPQGERTLAGVVLFGWSPLVLYTTAGGAHNDIFMVACLLLAAWCSTRGWFTRAAWALTLGALLKYIPVLFIPLLAVHAWHSLPTRARRIQWASTAIAGAALITLVCFTPFLQSFLTRDAFGVARRATLFTSSFPAWLRSVLTVYFNIPRETSAPWLSRLAVLALGLATVFALRPARHAPWQAARDLLLFYLLCTCLWFMPWYLAWPLAFAALLPETPATRALLLLSTLLLCKGVFFEFILMPGGKGPPSTMRELLLAPLFLGPVWLYLALSWMRHVSLRHKTPFA